MKRMSKQEYEWAIPLLAPVPLPKEYEAMLIDAIVDRLLREDVWPDWIGSDVDFFDEHTLIDG